MKNVLFDVAFVLVIVSTYWSFSEVFFGRKAVKPAAGASGSQRRVR